MVKEPLRSGTVQIPSQTNKMFIPVEVSFVPLRKDPKDMAKTKLSIKGNLCNI